MSHSLDQLRAQIDDLSNQPPQDTAAAWRQIRDQVDVICKNLANGSASDAHASLPVLADLITQLERVIGELRPRNPQG